MQKQTCRSLWAVLCLGLLLVTVSVGATDRPLNVYVVNYPLKYFADRIGGPHVRVALPVPTGEDPVYWTPAIVDIAAYQQADLILLNGAGYAKWVSKVSLPRSKTVDTSLGFTDQFITVKQITTHNPQPRCRRGTRPRGIGLHHLAGPFPGDQAGAGGCRSFDS